jgi:hypothetical protein
MPDDAALAEAIDPAVLRLERRLRELEKMARLEMELAEVLQRQAIAAANSAPPPRRPLLAPPRKQPVNFRLPSPASHVPFD